METMTTKQPKFGPAKGSSHANEPKNKKIGLSCSQTTLRDFERLATICDMDKSKTFARMLAFAHARLEDFLPNKF